MGGRFHGLRSATNHDAYDQVAALPFVLFSISSGPSWPVGRRARRNTHGEYLRTIRCRHLLDHTLCARGWFQILTPSLNLIIFFKWHSEVNLQHVQLRVSVSASRATATLLFDLLLYSSTSSHPLHPSIHSNTRLIQQSTTSDHTPAVINTSNTTPTITMPREKKLPDGETLRHR